jgi:hypothetical protein
MNEQQNPNDIPELVWDDVPVKKTLRGDNRRAVVHTLHDDVERAMNHGQGGTMASILEEVRRQKKEKSNKFAFSKKNLVYLLASAGLIIAAGLVIWFVFRSAFVKTVPIEQGVQVPSIVPADQDAAIDITEASSFKIAGLAEEAINNNENIFEELTHLYFTKNTDRGLGRVTLGTLVSDLEIELPARLASGLSNDFMFGVFTTTDDHSFLVLEVRSFDRVFAGMKDWEQDMLDDLKGLLAIDETLLAPESFTEQFTDKLIDNKNMRVLSVPQLVQRTEQVPVESLAEEFVGLFSESATATIADDEDTPPESEGLGVLSEEELLGFLTVEGVEPRFTTRTVTELGAPKIALAYSFLSERLLVIATDPVAIDEIKERLADRQIFE